MRTSEWKRKREREGRREERRERKVGKKGEKKKEKAARKQQGQTKSKCYRQIMYLDIMHRRLQSVMINLFRLLLYQCFINILQLPAARISYQYNSLSKTLLRRGYVVLLFTETLILLGVLVLFFCNIRVTVCFSACILSALSSVCPITTWLSSRLSQSKRAGMWKICPQLL